MTGQPLQSGHLFYYFNKVTPHTTFKRYNEGKSSHLEIFSSHVCVTPSKKFFKTLKNVYMINFHTTIFINKNAVAFLL